MTKFLLSVLLGVSTVVLLAQPAPLAGRWLFQAETSAGSTFPILTLQITTDGDTATAEVTRTQAPFEVTVQSFEIDQSTVTLVTKAGPSELIFTGALEGPLIRGTIGGAPFDGLPFVASRTVQVGVHELFTLDAPNAYVAFSPDGKLLATGSRAANPDTPGELKLWDLATGEELALLMGHFGGIGAVAFSPDGKSLATGGLDTTVKLWDVATREERNTLRGHASLVVEAVFSPDGKTLATSTGVDRRLGNVLDNEVRLWDVQTAEERAVLRFQGVALSSIFALAFSPDGKVLATGSMNTPTPDGGRGGRLTLWDLASGEGHMVQQGPGGAILAVAFTPDGKVVASGGFGRIPRLWDVASGRQLRALPLQGNWIYALAFSPDGEILVTGTGSTRARSSPGEVKLWDTATGEELAAVDTDGHGVMSVAFSPDGKKLAVGMFDGNTTIWGITTENAR